MKPLDELTLYELMNVEPWASPGDIRRAYHMGLATYGTDSIAAHNILEEDDRENMRQRLEAAYRTLMDPERRVTYDRSLSGYTEEPPSEAPAADLPTSESEAGEGPSSFRGPDLKRYREELGISLESISYDTKIKICHLESIEAENFDDLPGPFFLRGFVKAYASCLKLDPEDLLREFLQSSPS
jgi:curved DNA-binding protein CbpA